MKNLFLKNLCLFILLIILSTCSRNPVTGKKELSFMSEKKEIAIGKANDPSIVASFGLYNDRKIQSFINTKGQQMAKISHRPNLAYEFKVLDSSVLNAFALPGGYVYFTRGILAHFNNEAEFAGVLGHEIGHITARHGARQQTKQVIANVGLTAGSILSPQFASMAQSASQGLQLLFLKFSRNHESESDELGVDYSTKIGYDAHQMAGFFQTLSRMQEKSGQVIPEFMSTHPDPGNRNVRVHRLAKEAQEKSNRNNLKVNRDSYLRMIDGLVYGEDPQQGYEEKNVFYHPAMKFQFPKPNGWQLQNSPQQVQMAPKGGKALSIFTIAQGRDMNAVKSKMVQDLKLSILQEQNERVNGLPALAFIGDQTNPQTKATIRVMTYLIKYNNAIYVFHGISSQADFNKYSSTFKNSFEGFSKLTDPSKINVKPERIQIETVKSNGSLSQTLKALNMPQARHNELALINGMQLSDKLKAGSLIKTIGK